MNKQLRTKKPKCFISNTNNNETKLSAKIICIECVKTFDVFAWDVKNTNIVKIKGDFLEFDFN